MSEEGVVGDTTPPRRWPKLTWACRHRPSGRCHAEDSQTIAERSPPGRCRTEGSQTFTRIFCSQRGYLNRPHLLNIPKELRKPMSDSPADIFPKSDVPGTCNHMRSVYRCTRYSQSASCNHVRSAYGFMRSDAMEALLHHTITGDHIKQDLRCT